MFEDYQEKDFQDFPGLWNRGTDDQVPQDHFSDCLNIDYDEARFFTRFGLSPSITPGYAGGVIRKFVDIFSTIGNVITLILDNAGNLYTFSARAGDTATVPLITVAGATSFAALQMFNRIYIAFSNGIVGTPATNLKVYIPNNNIALDVIRDAAGLAPAPVSPMLAAPGATGLVNPGAYEIAVSFVTTSGFITPPGPVIATVYTPTLYQASAGKQATNTLVSDGTDFVDGETVTIGGVVYTFKTNLTANGGTPNEIHIVVGSTSTTLANFATALQGSGNPGVDYGAGSVLGTSLGVGAFAVGNTLFLVASDGGTKGNSITTTETCAHAAWNSATLAGGTNGFKISLSAIPTGPAGTAQRQILITKANEKELFFLPSAFGGVINDNVTTVATLDFDDTVDLVSSADYLFDQMPTIPSPLGLTEYHGRLITYGETNNQSITRSSQTGNPESFDVTDSITNISRDDGFVCTNAVVLRDIMYVHKNLGVQAVQDNGNIPADWSVYPVDKAINTPSQGISEFFGMSGVRATRDLYFCVDRSGIIIFNGTFIKPPLTYKINSFWQRLNFAHYEKVQLVVDEQNHKMYCAFPIDTSAENDTLIIGDYSKCGPFNPYSVFQEMMKIKWSIWKFNPGGTFKRPTCIGLIAVVPDAVPTFKVGSLDGTKLWKLDPTTTDDDGTAIESYVESALLFHKSGWTHLFAATQLRIIGSGNLRITARGEDNANPKNLFEIGVNNPPLFFGVGLNDLTVTGAFTAGANKDFVVKISTAAATDKFQWSNDGGQTFSAEILMTGAAQLLSDGISVTFAATTGHTLGDNWLINALNNPITLSTASDIVTEIFDFQDEKMKIKYRLTSGFMKVSMTKVYDLPMYPVLPA